MNLFKQFNHIKKYIKIRQKSIIIILLILLVAESFSNNFNKDQIRGQINNILKSIQRKTASPINIPSDKLKVIKEESVIVDVVKKVSPSVVTVTIKTPAKNVFEFSPFRGFSQGVRGGEPQDIGTGQILKENIKLLPRMKKFMIFRRSSVTL